MPNLLGEFDHYLDTGCEVSPACLSCPLPECKHDNPVAHAAYMQQQRDIEMVAEIERDGLSGVQAGLRFGITSRTVFRIKERVKRVTR